MTGCVRFWPHSLAFLTSREVVVAHLQGRKTYGATAPPPRILTSQHVAFFEAEKKVWLEDTNGRREALFARKFSDDRLDLVDRLDRMIMRKEEPTSAFS